MLPKLQHPTFTVIIPSTKATASFRPYTVREQKILLMLKESTDGEELTTCIKDLIESCCTEPITVSKLSYFDIEYIFLKLRSNSVGETSKISFKCNNLIEDKTCGSVSTVEVDLRSIEVDFSTSSKTDIEIQDGIIISMSYPNIKSTRLIGEYETNKDINLLMQAISNDIKYVADSEVVYEEFSEEEILNFVSSLKLASFDKILNFYANCPSIKKKVQFTCSKCGYAEEIILSGISDFFD